MKAQLMSRRADVGIALTGVVAGVIGGVLFASSIEVGVLYVGGCLLLALVLVRPVALGVIACACTFAVQRLGSGAGGDGVSVSDVVLVLATAIALPSLASGPELRRLRTPLIGLAVYLVALLPTVVTDDSSRGPFEWGHRLFLVGGAMVVGAWIAREGHVVVALRAVVAVSCVVAVAAMIYSVRNGFAPAFPLGLHKNFVGAMLKIALIVGALAPRQLGLRLRGRIFLLTIIGGGLLASQSRGAMLAAAAAIVFAVAFSPRTQNRQARGVVLLLTVALAGFAYFSIRADFSESTADFENNSIGQRQQVESRAHEIWRTSPAKGVGLKYFNSGEWGPLAQPANVVVDNELAESGVIGLAGFAFLQISLVRAALRRRRDDPFAIVGAACVVAALAHGMVDIYWTAGTVTLPFIVLGMALGEAPSDQSKSLVEPKRRSSALVST